MPSSGSPSDGGSLGGDPLPAPKAHFLRLPRRLKCEDTFLGSLPSHRASVSPSAEGRDQAGDLWGRAFCRVTGHEGLVGRQTPLGRL